MSAQNVSSMGSIMSFDLTILKKKVDGLKEAYENGNFADALIGALNTGNGLMQQRVFSQTEDVEGNSFGQYVGKKRKVKTKPTSNRTQAKRNKAIEGQFLTSYQRKRASKGRQVAKKDLEFSGGLRRAIETQAENEKTAVIQFNNSEAAKIAKGQEAQITNIRNGGKGTTKGEGIKIFSLNNIEKETVIEQGAELITQILKPK
jgi:hypothetical protein